MRALWYPGHTMTRVGALVRVRWGWMPTFEAMLMQNAPRKWAMMVNDKLVYLPPKTQRVWQSTFGGEEAKVTHGWLEARNWGPEPDAWQPILPQDWTDPLPEPLGRMLVADKGRMVTIGTIAFDATAAAEEMERDRLEARNRPRGDDDAEEDGLIRSDGKRWDWWRNPSLIVYQPRGEVTRDMAEGRLLRAVAWCGAAQEFGLTANVFTSSQILADAIAIDAAHVAPIRFQPLQRDIGDFLEAMRWFAQLGGERRRARAWTLSVRQEVVVRRSLLLPQSFGDIALAFAFSRERARQVYQRAIDVAHQVANQPLLADPRIAALRDRNRAAKRAQQ